MATQFAEAVPTPRPPVAPTLVSGARLFVDASRSMGGFAGCNARPTEFNTILDRLTTDLTIASVVRFGQRAEDASTFEELPLTRAVHCPAFYDRRQNPDYELYRAIEADSQHTQFVYVTDGVQSDISGTNQSPSVDALKRWIEDGNSLAILAFHSQFRGPAWSESRQQMVGTADVPRRPFYAFVLTRSAGELSGLLQKLSSATTARATVISFAPAAVSCSARPARRLPTYTVSTSPPWAMLARDLFREQRELSRPVLQYECQTDPRYPVSTILPMLDVQYRQWRNSGWTEPSEPLSGASFGADSLMEDRKGVVVQGTLPFDTQTRYGLYLVRFTGRPGELMPAIDSLSTDSDADLASFDRTYRFSWLTEQLARVHLARWLPVVPFAFTVQYR